LPGAAAAQATPVEQPALALDRFNPAWAHDTFHGVASPDVGGHVVGHGLVLGSWAHNPLVLHERGANGDGDLGAIVENQVLLHLGGSFALWDRAAVGVDLPLVLAQGGSDPSFGTVAFSSPSGAEIADLRIGARVRLFGERDDLAALAIGGYLWVPTGDGEPGSFAGTGSVRSMPDVIFGGAFKRLVYAAELGTELGASRSFTGVAQGALLRWGVAGGVRLGPREEVLVGGELLGSLGLEDVEQRTTHLEVLASAKWRIWGPLVAGLAAGPGLSAGIGTPDFRGLVGVAFSPEPAPRDSDEDGIADAADACPDTPGVATNEPNTHGCPPPPPDTDGDGIPDDFDACPTVQGPPHADRAQHGCPPPPDSDGDGIPDSLDACPTERGPADGDPKKNGCPPPPDTDGDGIADPLDACPTERGPADGDPKKNGCPPPPDTDGDGIADPVDACPADKGLPNDDPKKNGCPRVLVTATQIVIHERVEFDVGKATLRPESAGILDAVAEVLRAHPDIDKVEVQGHTDDRGGRGPNKALSQARANAVVAALAKRGIDRKRLSAKGYGQERPVQPNESDAGRQANRRVQFDILARKAP
jgi:outer membrane protein OmpA-like peptidoglycan-associated protein